jgi:hypothetical protein
MHRRLKLKSVCLRRVLERFRPHEYALTQDYLGSLLNSYQETQGQLSLLLHTGSYLPHHARFL